MTSTGRRRAEDLGELRRDLPRGVPAGGEIDRERPPAEDVEALFGSDLGDHPSGVGRRGLVRRQEGDAGDVPADLRKREIDDGAQERVGHLEEDPGAVTGLGVGAERAAMPEVLERGERGVDELVARGPTEVRHECDAAGVMLEARVVETFR